MVPSSLRGAALVAVLALPGSVLAQPPATTLPPPRPSDKLDQSVPADAGIEVLNRGPIHEAFAQPGADVRGKGMTAPQAPPPPIPELPPDTKPDGNNVKWIPGYWAWDNEKKDFIWISGFYRDVPPDRDWQPGQWIEQGGKWIYLPGWWRPVNLNRWRIDLPEPPRSLERGPSTPPDDPNAVWIPGVWEFRNEQYLWRPGYWAVPNGNLIWQPPQYIVTGSGYCYVPGYWDYPLEERGLLFAPVCFTQPLWRTPGWCFRPGFALNIGFGLGGWGYGAFFNSLFIGPGWNTFCFGDYFPSIGWGGPWIGWGNPIWSCAFGLGTAWCGWGGYRPWCVPNPGFCNPLWRNYCWLNRNNPNWAATVQASYVAQSLGTLPRSVAVSNRPAPATVRPLAITPQGFAGAAQTAVRSAVAAVKPTPIIQPAQEVARSLQASRVTANQTSNRASNTATGTRPPANAAVASAMRPSPVQAPPVHATSRPATGRGPDPSNLAITPGGQATNRPVIPAGGNNAPRNTDWGPLTENTSRPNAAAMNRSEPLQTGRANPARITPPDDSPPIRPDRNAGSLNLGLPQDLTPPRPPVRGNSVMPTAPTTRPNLSAPQVAPRTAPAAPAARPASSTIRPAAPATPAILPSSSIAPALRPGPINPVGGGAMRSPAGGATGRPPIRR